MGIGIHHTEWNENMMTKPKIGDTVALFGSRYVVDIVEPGSDWTWYVELSDDDGEIAILSVPSKTRTVA